VHQAFLQTRDAVGGSLGIGLDISQPQDSKGLSVVNLMYQVTASPLVQQDGVQVLNNSTLVDQVSNCENDGVLLCCIVELGLGAKLDGLDYKLGPK
jgi:hypothetical protein